MKQERSRPLRAFFGGPVSAAGFLATALVLALVYLALDAAGLRSMTSILSGTPPPGAASPGSAAALGLVYVVAYMGFMVVAPVLAIAALAQFLARLLTGEPPGEKSSGSGHGAGSMPS